MVEDRSFRNKNSGGSKTGEKDFLLKTINIFTPCEYTVEYSKKE